MLRVNNRKVSWYEKIFKCKLFHVQSQSQVIARVIINVFLSHRWGNDEKYQQIDSWLKESNIECRMYAVSKEEKENHDAGVMSDRELEEILIHRIKVSTLFICFNDKSYSSASFNWSQFELKIARKMGKKILVIKRWGMNQLPESLKDNNGVVGWNRAPVIDAIKKLA